MNIFGILIIVAVAIGLLLWKKCGGSCGTKEQDKKK